jgi:hypothetical protein
VAAHFLAFHDGETQVFNFFSAESAENVPLFLRESAAAWDAQMRLEGPEGRKAREPAA